MIEVRRFGGSGGRALNGVFGVAEKWGKGRSFVEQDKASAVQCREIRRFLQYPNGLSPTSGQLEPPAAQYGEKHLGAGRSKAAV